MPTLGVEGVVSSNVFCFLKEGRIIEKEWTRLASMLFMFNLWMLKLAFPVLGKKGLNE